MQCKNTFVKLLACLQGFFNGGVVVGGVQVEQVDTGRLQPGQGGAELLQHARSSQTRVEKRIGFSSNWYLHGPSSKTG